MASPQRHAFDLPATSGRHGVTSPNSSGWGMTQLPARSDPTSMVGGAVPGGSPGRHNGSSGSAAAAPSGRDVEQRYAKLVADAEYKLLEERSHAQEREARLKEELARERAQMQRAVQERAEQLIRERGLHPAGGAGASRQLQVVAEDAGEVDRLRRQLEETKQLLSDAERRYQQEKRELLNLRTAQLKSETSKRGQEGDIIARAMQVMSEYEAVVRSSEENSLARLAHHMENFEKEWIRRSREFDERKSEFEATVIARVLETLRLHHKDLESVGRQLLEQSVELAKTQSDNRINIEEEVMRHSEVFKEQYKEILENEFYERCRLYNEKIAERERNWVKIMQEEREKIIAAEQRAVKEHESLHVQALSDAMKDISTLREQLVQEHQQRQAEAMKDILARRSAMKEEQEEMIDAINQRVAEVQLECARAIEKAQLQLKDLHMQMAQREAQVTQELMQKDREMDAAVLSKVADFREDLESQWRKTLEHTREKHHSELEEVTKAYQEKIAQIRQEHDASDAELRRKLDQRMVEAEEAAEYRWSGRIQEAMTGLERHMEVIQALRDDNEKLSAQLSTAQQHLELKNVEMEGFLAKAQRDQEHIWFKKMEEMRWRYDKLLDDALGDVEGENGGRVNRDDYEQLLEECKRWEERCVDIKRTEAERLQREREELNSIWRKRLEEERKERAVWEEEQLRHVADLRIELLSEVKQKELELQRRVDDERTQIHEELVRSLAKERETRDAIQTQIRADADERVRHAEQDFRKAYEEQSRVLEERIAAKEEAVAQLELELRRDRQRAEEAARERAMAMLEEERRVLSADIDRQLAHLESERSDLASQRTLMQQKLVMEYSRRFEESKHAMEAQMLKVVELQLHHWQQCEAAWLQFRRDDLAKRQQERVEYAEQMEKRSRAAIQAARKEAEELIRVERDALDTRHASYLAEVESSRLASENAARNRALKLIEDQNRIQLDANEKRARDTAQRWDEMQRSVLEKERQVEAARQNMERDLQQRYDELLGTERQRVEAALEQQQQALREVKRRHEQDLLKRDEEWRKRYEDMESEDRKRQESLLSELRKDSEKRVHDERQRFDAALEEREAAFAAERQRLLDVLERQLKDHERTAAGQVSRLQEDYEKRIQVVLADALRQRDQYVKDLADQERRHQALREEYERDITRKFQDSMATLRDALEQKVREQLESEGEMQRRLEDQRVALQKQMNQEYEAFIREQEERMVRMNEERARHSAEAEREHQDQLFALRHDMEETLAAFFEQHDLRTREAAEEARQNFSEKLGSYHRTIEEERQKRMEVENKLRAVEGELDELKAAVESQKLQVMQEVHEKYEKLYGDLKEKGRREKEAAARRALEDEERRLVKELLQRDPSRLLMDAKPRQPPAGDAAATTAAAHASGPRAPLPGTGPSALAATPAARGIYHSQVPSTVHTPSHGSLPEVGAPPRTGAPGAAGNSGLNQSNLSSGTSYARRSTSTAPDPYPTPAPGTTPPTEDDIRRQREKLLQLWQVLDVPSADQQLYLRRIQSLPPTQLYDELAREIRRYEVQLPLLEVVTRREFVLHRIKELEREMDQGGGDGDRSTAEAMEEFKRELRRLTEHLRVEIPKHESRHGSTFVFRGHRYMESLLRS